MNTSTDAGQRAREALASQLEADGRTTFAQIIRDHGIAEHDQFDGPLVIRALEAAFASPVTPAAAVDREAIRRIVKNIAVKFDWLDGVPYDTQIENWVSELVTAVTPAAATIPEGMVPWAGGVRAPSGWDG